MGKRKKGGRIMSYGKSREVREFEGKRGHSGEGKGREYEGKGS